MDTLKRAIKELHSIGVPLVLEGTLQDMCNQSGFTTSKAETARLIKQNAVREVDVENAPFPVLKVGKQRAYIIPKEYEKTLWRLSGKRK